MNKGILLCCLMAVLLSACAAPAPVVQSVEVTRVVRETVVVTQLVVITATPLPPTATPPPTMTPTPYARWTADQVVEAFQAAGLQVTSPKVMDRADYGMAPSTATKGIRFLIPSLGENAGGRILQFDEPGGQAATKNYYEALGSTSKAFFSWVFERDNIVVQINGSLPEETALKYKAVLEGMK